MIFVTGATGLLGSTLVPWLKQQGSMVSTHARSGHADYSADMTSKDEVLALLDKIQPSVIINLVGLTSVDLCQERVNEAYLLNTRTVENLAYWILQRGADCHLVHISTDQVYDGTSLHTEDQVTLTNNYAFSKYAGELAAAQVSSTILRTNFIGRSRVGNRVSLTDWIYASLTGSKHIQVLSDVYFSPLAMDTLAEIIQLVAEKKPLGVFNLGSRDGMSKADFAFGFAEYLGLPTVTMTRIDSSQATFLKAYRPHDMRMDCSKLESYFGIKLPSLLDQIKSVAKEYQ